MQIEGRKDRGKKQTKRKKIEGMTEACVREVLTRNPNPTCHRITFF